MHFGCMDCFVCYLVFTEVANGFISNWYIEIKKKVDKKVIENFCDYIKNTTALLRRGSSVRIASESHKAVT